MRYCETAERSAELLRLALPLMSKHAAGFHPVAYAVWYEYVAGINPELRAGLDARLADQTPLSEEETQTFFTRFILARDAALIDGLESKLQEVLKTMRESAISLGNEAARYGESLGQAGEQLLQPLDGPALSRLVEALTGETLQMRGSTRNLQEQLQSRSQEINALREQLKQAQGEALIDPLSGLHNRRGFESALRAAAAMTVEAGTPCTLLMVDIDHFKRVNDSYGHLFGDRVIRSVAQSIALNVKGRDTAARYGGEEFAVLLPGAKLAGALVVADQIRVTIARGRFVRAGKEQEIGGITVSIGVAESIAGETPEDWVARADAALYESKVSGRNRVTRASVSARPGTASGGFARPQGGAFAGTVGD